MLAEGYDHLETCADGCTLAEPIDVDGHLVEVHHWIPDDFAPHTPTPECGCGPVLRAEAPQAFLRYEHVDQDPTDKPAWEAET